MTVEEEQRVWELYVVDCRTQDLAPSVRDFVIWKQEEGYE